MSGVADPKDVGSSCARLEQLVESTHLEMERMGEGQHFVSKILAHRLPNDERQTDRGP